MRLPNGGLLRADRARRRLGSFVTHLDPRLSPADHHRLLTEKLREVDEGSLKRLMVFWPPGHAKSTYASHYGPAWLMGRDPTRKIIHCSHTQDLAERFGRRIRNTLQSDEAIDVFGHTIAADARAASRWETLQGGEYFAAGVGGGITGRRFDIGLIDDPVKSRKEADSPTYRESTWQWYTGDFRTRQKPGAAIIIIQTRWHEDDLSGRILPADYAFESGWITARDGEKWFVLNFPAICERGDDGTGRGVGEPLWPGYISLQMLDQERISQGSRNWAALYQQRPRPSEGGMFKEAWCRTRWNQIPVEAKTCVHSWDTAQKAGELNDPSAGTVWQFGRGAVGYWLRESITERLEYPSLKRRVIGLAERDNPAAILIEDKSSGQSLIQDLRESTSLPIIAIEPLKDKIFRANEVSAMVESGLVHLPERAPWLVDFEGEFFGFPVSTHDDQVDSTTQFLKWVRGWTMKIEHVGVNSRIGSKGTESEVGFGSVGRGGDFQGYNNG